MESLQTNKIYIIWLDVAITKSQQVNFCIKRLAKKSRTQHIKISKKKAANSQLEKKTQYLNSKKQKSEQAFVASNWCLTEVKREKKWKTEVINWAKRSNKFQLNIGTSIDHFFNKSWVKTKKKCSFSKLVFVDKFNDRNSWFYSIDFHHFLCYTFNECNSRSTDVQSNRRHNVRR